MDYFQEWDIVNLDHNFQSPAAYTDYKISSTNSKILFALFLGKERKTLS
jgi:hypothetical protein